MELQTDSPTFAVRVQGEIACFTRPEMKVERVSYDVLTPSAARGLLEAIYWKPEIRWRVQRIHVLKPIRRFSILRTEVKSTANPKAAQKGERFIAQDQHTQRHTLALRDVAYLIEADVDPTARGKEDGVVKHRDQFRRRVRRGQSFHRPYLGCREFAACFDEPDGSERVPDELAGRTEVLGRMLFDLDFKGKDGRGTPRFFNAELREGVLHVPQHLYDEINL